MPPVRRPTPEFHQVALGSARLSTVGVVVKTDPDSTPQANPFCFKGILEIEDVCCRSSINLFATLPVDEHNFPLEVPQLLANERVDGLLRIGTFVDETIASITGKRTPPIMLVDGYPITGGFDRVISDNFQAAFQTVRYLIEKATATSACLEVRSTPTPA